MELSKTKIQFWTRRQFSAMGVSEPVCDQCSVVFKDFPVPVVHHSFDYTMDHFDDLGRRTGGFVMKVGLAMCPSCFLAVIEELEKNGEEIITEYNCGCETQKVGQQFFIKPCSPDCEIYKMVIEKSKARGNAIMFRRNS